MGMNSSAPGTSESPPERVVISGIGAVSPAGWGIEALATALKEKRPAPISELVPPGRSSPLRVRKAPPPEKRASFASHARLRRVSAISQFAVAAAIEALGPLLDEVKEKRTRLGVVLCVMSGCVNYSRRFYDESLRDPATASPLVFPETVFNAPASHLAPLIGTPAMNYTLVGDPGTFLQGVALAAQWLQAGHVDGCLVAGGEECDWLTADAFHLFSRALVLADGAGALYLKRQADGPPAAELRSITNSHLFHARQTRLHAARHLRAELPACSETHLL